MKLSDRGAQLIGNFEGFRSQPYRDAVGVWTIGYGSTKGVGPNTRPVSREQAMARLKRETDATYGAAVDRVNREHKLGLNQNQFDALSSFTYNVGPGGIGPDTGVGKALRAKQWQRVVDEMQEWNKGGGQVLPGLVRRRKEEGQLFLKKPPPPPIRYSKDEKHLIRVLKDKKASKERRERAERGLKEQAAKIQKAARSERNGWDKHDRGRRYQGIRRAVKRYG
jgi:lysozyme